MKSLGFSDVIIVKNSIFLYEKVGYFQHCIQWLVQITDTIFDSYGGLLQEYCLELLKEQRESY